jgi:uncharacterized protein YqiB (DUF1249 family)
MLPRTQVGHSNDELLPVSWRSRRGDFVSLMTLYESNYVRLRRLVPEVQTIEGAFTSNVATDCPLHLRIEERGRYTTTLTLTYLFETGVGQIADPDLQVRIYHDARVAEVLSCARWHRHEVLATIKNHLYCQLGDRWLRNVMLNKWLDYCVERGHRFTATAG